MPLYSVRKVEPSKISRRTLPEKNTAIDDLEAVANGTLCNIIRQLSDISKHAIEIFTGLISVATEMSTRSANLQARMAVLTVKMNEIEEDLGERSIQDCINVMPYHISTSFDQEVVSRTSMSSCIVILHQKCDGLPPFEVVDPYRDDGKLGSKFYSDPSFFFDIWRDEMLQCHPHKSHRKDEATSSGKNEIKEDDKVTREMPKRITQSDSSGKSIPPGVAVGSASQGLPVTGTVAPPPPPPGGATGSLVLGGNNPSSLMPPPPPIPPPFNGDTDELPTPPPVPGKSLNDQRICSSTAPPLPPKLEPSSGRIPPPTLAPRVASSSGPASPPTLTSNLPGPPPPPPPPAMNFPAPPPPPPLLASLPTSGTGDQGPKEKRAIPPPAADPRSDLLNAIRNRGGNNGLKACPKEKREIPPPAADPRSDLLTAIRGGIALKKVDPVSQEEKNSKKLSDVTEILRRRLALEISDSESESAEASDDDWVENE